MDWVKQLAQYAGPIALASFAGVFLGGLALSFFWKNFGPWKLLEACKAECLECAKDREEKDKDILRMQGEISDLNARLDIFTKAAEAGGLALSLSPRSRT
jgi:hypothetical protein